MYNEIIHEGKFVTLNKLNGWYEYTSPTQCINNEAVSVLV